MREFTFRELRVWGVAMAVMVGFLALEAIRHDDVSDLREAIHHLEEQINVETD